MAYPVTKCQLSNEDACKLLLHMNEASWDGTPDEVKDVSGNDNHGTAAGTATTDANGKFGRCGDFNGAVDDYVNIADFSPTLDNYSIGSISLWAKPDVVDNNGVIISMGLDSNNRMMLFTDSTEPNLWRFYLKAGGVPRADFKSNFQNIIGQWYHIVITQDDTTIKMYVNGVLQDAYRDTGYWWNDMGTVYHIKIANRTYDNANPFTGLIDEVAVFSRVLSATEIKHNYIRNPKVMILPLEIIRTKDFSVNAFLRLIQTKTFDIDGFLVNRYTKAFDLDAFLKAIQTKDFIINGILSGFAERKRTFLIDAIIGGLFEKVPLWQGKKYKIIGIKLDLKNWKIHLDLKEL